MKTESLYWNPRPGPPEDASLVDEGHGIALVADGVTRSVDPGQAYPDPSPAWRAGRQILETMADKLRTHAATPRDLMLACQAANLAVRKLNQELGVWDHTDYWTRDLAGAVFAGLVLAPPRFLWGYIADSGVARLSARGRITWSTPDDLVDVVPSFPFDRSDPTARIVTIRREFRNRPEAPHPTYGVFTGEENALRYLRTGAEEVAPDDVLVVFTDGGRPLVEDPDFRALLVERAPAARLQQYVKRRHAGGGEKTLVVVRQS